MTLQVTLPDANTCILDTTRVAHMETIITHYADLQQGYSMFEFVKGTSQHETPLFFYEEVDDLSQ